MMEIYKGNEYESIHDVRRGLQRPDIIVLGEVDSSFFPDPKSDYTLVHRKNIVIAPKRPILELRSLQNFHVSILQGSPLQNYVPSRLKDSVRVGFKRTVSSMAREVDDSGKILQEHVEEIIVNIFPHHSLAKFALEYITEKSNERIVSHWNPIEESLLAVPDYALRGKNDMKVFVNSLRENHFYRLINETASRRYR